MGAAVALPAIIADANHGAGTTSTVAERPQIDRIAGFWVPHRMAAVMSEVAADVLELRSAALTLIAVVLKTADLDVLAGELEQRASVMPGLFDDEPVALDLSQVREAEPALDFPALIALLRRHRMMPVAVRGGNAGQMAAAFAAGLVEAPEGARPSRELVLAPPLVSERIVELQLPPLPPLIVDEPLRSGQQVYARGRDLVVLAHGELRRRSHRRRPHPRLRAAARPRARRRARQHRGAHLHDLPGARNCCPSPASTAPPKSPLPAEVAGPGRRRFAWTARAWSSRH